MICFLCSNPPNVLIADKACIVQLRYSSDGSILCTAPPRNAFSVATSTVFITVVVDQLKSNVVGFSYDRPVVTGVHPVSFFASAASRQALAVSGLNFGIPSPGPLAGQDSQDSDGQFATRKLMLSFGPTYVYTLAVKALGHSICRRSRGPRSQ